MKNVLAGTAYAMIKGIGDYSNAAMVPFTITTADIADGGEITSDIPEYTPMTVQPKANGQSHVYRNDI